MVIQSTLAYDFGIQLNSELIWKCNLCKTQELDSILGIDWSNTSFFKDIDQGKMMKWKVLSLEKDEERLNLTINLWKWQVESAWEESDEVKSFWYYSDPTQYPDNYNFSRNFPFIKAWLPLPMSEYVRELDLNQIYDIDDRVLFTIYIQIDGYGDSPDQVINMIAIFNESGFLQVFKIYLPGNVILLDITLDQIPIYTIPVIICIFGALIGVFIFYIFYLRPRREE